jgi:hypothetical protein
MSTNVETGVAEQAREKSAELVSQAQQQVQEKAQQAKSKAGGRLREQIDRRSTEAGEQVQSFAEAMRRTSQQLREDGNDGPARYAEQAASYVERVGTYFKDKTADAILSDAEGLARRRPWVIAGASAVVGLVASRFLKASGERRHEQRSGPPSFSPGGPQHRSDPEPPSPVGSNEYANAGAITPGAQALDRSAV